MVGFHAHGASVYGAAIRADYESQRRAIEEQVRQANSEEERRRLAEELRELKANFRAKIAHRGYKLF